MVTKSSARRTSSHRRRVGPAASRSVAPPITHAAKPATPPVAMRAGKPHGSIVPVPAAPVIALAQNMSNPTIRPVPSGSASLWYKTKRLLRRYREVIMIILTLLMSVAFLLFGFLYAIHLESQHPSWLPKGY